ncbi:MAG: hypothetical protein IT186_25560 [Acidobacteria bacterium]|nr:hypothetical protein [Acidobacteriota bacterium]
MTPRTVSPACRAFEEALETRLGLGVPKETEFPHIETCAGCRLLLGIVLANLELQQNLEPPRPQRGFLERLSGIPGHAEAVWKQSREVLALLRPGALEGPDLPESLTEKLHAIPAQSRRLAPVVTIRPVLTAPTRKRWYRDWRVAVAGMYAATLLIATALQFDPMSVARQTASDLTVRGEKAVAEARDRTAERLAESLRVSRTRPLRDQLDYRLYRAMAVSRAKAGAYAGFVVEKLFGQRQERERSVQTEKDGRTRTSGGFLEPESTSFRS